MIKIKLIFPCPSTSFFQSSIFLSSLLSQKGHKIWSYHKKTDVILDVYTFTSKQTSTRDSFCLETADYSLNLFTNMIWTLVGSFRPKLPPFSFVFLPNNHLGMWCAKYVVITQVVQFLKMKKMVTKGFSPFLSFLSAIWPQIQRTLQLINVMERHSWQHTDVLLAACAWKVELLESHKCDSRESHNSRESHLAQKDQIGKWLKQRHTMTVWKSGVFISSDRNDNKKKTKQDVGQSATELLWPLALSRETAWG